MFMASLPFITNPTSGSEKKDTGVVFKAGNVNTDTGPIQDSVTFKETNDKTPRFPQLVEASTPSQSGNLGTFKPLSGGTFAYHKEDKYVGMLFTDKLSGSKDTLLNSGAGELGKRRTINYIQDNRRYSINDWSYVSGVQEIDSATVGNKMDFTVNGEDEEAKPTRSKPGELNYMFGSKTPKQDDYPQRQSSTG